MWSWVFVLNLAGYRTMYLPGSVCRHAESASYGHHSGRAVYLSSRNLELTYFACMPGPLLLQTLPVHILTAMLHVFKYPRSLGLPYIRGKLAAILRMGEILRRRAEIAPFEKG